MREGGCGGKGQKQTKGSIVSVKNNKSNPNKVIPFKALLTCIRFTKGHFSFNLHWPEPNQ